MSEAQPIRQKKEEKPEERQDLSGGGERRLQRSLEKRIQQVPGATSDVCVQKSISALSCFSVQHISTILSEIVLTLSVWLLQITEDKLGPSRTTNLPNSTFSHTKAPENLHGYRVTKGCWRDKGSSPGSPAEVIHSEILGNTESFQIVCRAQSSPSAHQSVGDSFHHQLGVIIRPEEPSHHGNGPNGRNSNGCRKAHIQVLLTGLKVEG